MKKKKIMKKTIFMIFIDFIAIVCIFLMYGPITYFRNLWVTSAMTTMTHKYLAHIFFSDKTIDDIISNNYIKYNGETTNPDDIKINDVKQTDTYESIYEEQILKHDESEIYKIIQIEGTGYKGYMAVVYDPSRISLATAKYFGKGGQTIDKIMQNNQAILGVNSNGFMDGRAVGATGSLPCGTVIKNGKRIWGDSKNASLIGFNNDNILVLSSGDVKESIKNGMKDAIEFGPYLIINGKSVEIKGNGGFGLAPRTAVGQRKDGIVLFVVVDGRSSSSLGVDMNELINIFTRYGAYNAANLDGGGSSVMYANGKKINNTGELRYLPTAWIVK